MTNIVFLEYLAIEMAAHLEHHAEEWSIVVPGESQY